MDFVIFDFSAMSYIKVEEMAGMYAYTDDIDVATRLKLKSGTFILDDFEKYIETAGLGAEYRDNYIHLVPVKPETYAEKMRRRFRTIAESGDDEKVYEFMAELVGEGYGDGMNAQSVLDAAKSVPDVAKAC